MTAPIWQYFTLMVFVFLGFGINMLGIVVLSVGDRSKLRRNYEELRTSNLVSMILLSCFAGYLSYSLYAWSPGLLGTSLFVMHLTGIIAGFIKRIHLAGKEIDWAKAPGEVLFSVVYGIILFVLIVIYGVQCL